MNSVYSLRSLYELRKSVPLDLRRSVGRIFWEQDLLGIQDASGILWPIEADPALLKSNNVTDFSHLDFLCSFYRPDGLSSTKYKDTGYLLKVEKVLEVVPGERSQKQLPFTLDHVGAPHDSTSFFPGSFTTRKMRLGQRDIAHRRAQQYFRNRGFMQLFPPALVPSGGVEEYLNVFQTEYCDFRKKKWPLELATSPEFSIKKALVEGHKKVFSISPSFRNGGELSKWHQPEFTMIEWYRVGAHLETLINDVTLFIKSLGDSVGSLLTFSTEWPAFTISELVAEQTGLNLDELQDRQDFYDAARPFSQSLTENDDWPTIFSKIYLDKIEPFLASLPCCFVTDFPAQFAALAKPYHDRPLVMRVEGFLRGIEICNGFVELSDASEMKTRFNRILAARSGELTWDESFYTAMKQGLPPTAGMALGFDRTLAILLDCHSISELQLLPFEDLFSECRLEVR